MLQDEQGAQHNLHLANNNSISCVIPRPELTTKKYVITMTEMRVFIRLTEWKSIDRTILQNKQNWLIELMISTILGKKMKEEGQR